MLWPGRSLAQGTGLQENCPGLLARAEPVRSSLASRPLASSEQVGRWSEVNMDPNSG